MRFIAGCVATASLLAPTRAFAAKETVEFVTFPSLDGWTKEEKPATYTAFTIADKQKGHYCRIFLMLSLPTQGSLDADFDREWKTLVAGQYTLTGPMRVTEPGAEKNGWKIKAATAPYKTQSGPGTAILTTMSGYAKEFSIVGLTNGDEYLPVLKKFMDSTELSRPPIAAAAAATPAAASSTATPPGTGSATALATTNFDDGWIATAQEDWVQVTKGTTRVLIHYPNKVTDDYNPDLLDGLKNAWNVLVVPRYAAMKNLAFRPIHNFESIEFAEADATEKSSGRPVHVVLFKKNYSGGSGRFLEFITPDLKSFEREFGPYHATADGWEKMEALANRNKFGIRAELLAGKWSSKFSGSTQYVNAVTGFNAGIDTHASVENFKFGPGTGYAWDLAVADGMVGNIKFQSVKSSGKFSLQGDWKIAFSDIEGKPRTFDAHFSHIKGLRVLWLDDKPFAKLE